MISGALDMVDGKIAGMKKNRTVEQKHFGIQIDSLSDLICFGILPAVIGYSLDIRSVYAYIVFGCYALCALIRLAYFNVTEEQRQVSTMEPRRYYLGLPVTSIALTLPLFYLLKFSKSVNPFFEFIFIGLLALEAILFITPIKIKKPKGPAIFAMSLIGVAELFAYMFMVGT